MRWPRATAPAWPVHVLFLAVSVAASIAYHLAGHAGRPVVQTAVAAVPAAAFALALATGHLPHRRPWLVAVGGLVLLLGAQALWPAWVRDGNLGQATGGAADLMHSAAHGLFLVGTAMALRRRMAQDVAGILDAALLGICAGGPVWVWLVQPHLRADVSAVGEIMLLIDILTMCGVIGCFLRMAAAGGPGRGPILYLAVTAMVTLAAIVSSTWGNGVAAYLWLFAFLLLATAPLHPGAAEVTEPHRTATSDRDRAHLGWLAAVLSANPLLTAVQTLRGSESANLLLPIGTLMVIPLVLLRFRRLTLQRERAEQTLAYQASHDELTGLRNRRHILAELDEAVARLGRGDLTGLTVLLCDLDGFKPINDRFGHLAGDEALKVVAQRLIAVTTPDDLVARLGGDEFLVVRPEADAGDLVGRIHDALRVPMQLSAGPVELGVTIGTASARAGDAVDRTTLIGRADTVMYAGKSARAA